MLVGAALETRSIVVCEMRTELGDESKEVEAVYVAIGEIRALIKSQS